MFFDMFSQISGAYSIWVCLSEDKAVLKGGCWAWLGYAKSD